MLNVFSQHVLSEDVVSRELREGKLHTKRLLTKTNRVPKWGERFLFHLIDLKYPQMKL